MQVGLTRVFYYILNFRIRSFFTRNIFKLSAVYILKYLCKSNVKNSNSFSNSSVLQYACGIDSDLKFCETKAKLDLSS